MKVLSTSSLSKRETSTSYAKSPHSSYNTKNSFRQLFPHVWIHNKNLILEFCCTKKKWERRKTLPHMWHPCRCIVRKIFFNYSFMWEWMMHDAQYKFLGMNFNYFLNHCTSVKQGNFLWMSSYRRNNWCIPWIFIEKNIKKVFLGKIPN